MEPRMPFEPGLYARMLVGAVIVYDHMQVEPSWGLSVYSLEKTDKLLMPMAWHAIADYLAIEHTEGCK